MNTNIYPHRLVRVVFAFAAIGLCLSVLTAEVRAEGVMNIKQTIDVTELGDATIVMHMSFNASQFQNWQRRYGMNPSLLKREMSKELTPYDVTDFKLDKNEMDREVTITIKARGVTTNRGNGRNEIEVPKNWRLVDQDDHELKFNYLESVGNGVSIQGDVTTTLPATASDISEPVPAEGGMKRITYQMPVKSGGSGFGLIPGIGLAVVGLIVTVLGLAKGKSSGAA